MKKKNLLRRILCLRWMSGSELVLELYNRVCNLIWHGKWVFCYHEDRDIIPIGFADWKCKKCGIES